MRAWGRLLRLSLAPSAAADIAAGVMLGAGEWPRGAAPFALIGGSLCVYHGGMALNDWADRGEDARVRPDRPIPSGAISARSALALALVLLVLGPLLGFAADHRSGAILAAVAGLVVLYDVAGRGPWSGPALLAACRGGNLLAGIALGAAGDGFDPGPHSHVQWATFEPRLFGIECYVWESALPVVLLYAGYVFVVSRLGRLEDTRDERTLGRLPKVLLWTAGALLVAAPFAARAGRIGGFSAAQGETFAAALLAGFGASGIAQAARAESWTRGLVLRAMGVSLRRLLVFTAAAALAVGGPDAWIVAGLILTGFPISYALRGVFPPS